MEEGVRGLVVLTAAIFGLVGVVIGAVLSAVLNHWLQRSQDLRRWGREDERRFEQERLSLYRDFLNQMDRVYTLGKVDNERVSAILAEMWLLSSRAVYIQADMAFGASMAMVEELRRNSGNSGDFDPSELRAIEDFDVMDGMRREMIHRFNEEVRDELGVPTDWEQIPEDAETVGEASEGSPSPTPPRAALRRPYRGPGGSSGGKGRMEPGPCYTGGASCTSCATARNRGDGMKMATRQINSGAARDELPDLLARAAYAHERTIIAKRGRPLAALISIEELEILERFLEEYRDHMDADAADRVMADDSDEIIPFRRTT